MTINRMAVMEIILALLLKKQIIINIHIITKIIVKKSFI